MQKTLENVLDNLKLDKNSLVVEPVNNIPASLTSWFVIKARMETKTLPKEKCVTWHLLQGKVSYQIYKEDNKPSRPMINCHNNANQFSNNMLHFSGRDMPSRPVTSTKDLIELEDIVRSIADGGIVKAKEMGLVSFTSIRSWNNNNAS